MMHRRWLIGLCLLAGLALGFLTSGHWIGPDASRILTLSTAQFSVRLADGSETPPEEVSLPHKWSIPLCAARCGRGYLLRHGSPRETDHHAATPRQLGNLERLAAMDRARITRPCWPFWLLG